jgi:hypothetical protein
MTGDSSTTRVLPEVDEVVSKFVSLEGDGGVSSENSAQTCHLIVYEGVHRVQDYSSYR